MDKSPRNEGEVYGVPQTKLDEIFKMCGSGGSSDLLLSAPAVASKAAPSHKDQWVFNRQHNGLGNQLFQYAFSRLMAESLGRKWSTSLLVPERGESPWKKIEFPPNSENGWALFSEVFGRADQMFDPQQQLSSGSQHRLRVNASQSSCLDTEGGRCMISDRPWDVHVSKKSLLDQMIAALYGNGCASKCIFTIGYFQEPLFFSPYRARVLSWLGPDLATPPPADSYPPLGPEDIVVHVRCCTHSGGGCDWLYLPFEYYDAVLSRLTARHPRADVFLVAPCNGDCEMVEQFRRKYRATHVTPPHFRQMRDKAKYQLAMAADFRFLLQAPLLVLGKSTFGFWAGYLSPNAAEVHMPVESRRHHFEKIPVLAGDGRFVYHNPGRDEWFGRAQGGDGAMRYEERGRWFGPKVLDEMGNFLVTKKARREKEGASG